MVCVYRWNGSKCISSDEEIKKRKPSARAERHNTREDMVNNNKNVSMNEMNNIRFIVMHICSEVLKDG